MGWCSGKSICRGRGCRNPPGNRAGEGRVENVPGQGASWEEAWQQERARPPSAAGVPSLKRSACARPNIPERRCASRLDGRRRQNISACSVVMTCVVERGQFVRTLALRAQSQVPVTQNTLCLGDWTWELRELNRQLSQTRRRSRPSRLPPGKVQPHLIPGLSWAGNRPGQAQVVLRAEAACLWISASSELCDPGQVTKPL